MFPNIYDFWQAQRLPDALLSLDYMYFVIFLKNAIF